MPLFNVPDWDIPSPVQPADRSTKPSKKRKWSAHEDDARVGEAAFNFEKLVKQLEEGSSTSPKEKKKAHKSEKKAERASSKTDQRPEGKKEKKKTSKEKPSKISEDSTTRPPKKKRKKDNKSEQTHTGAEDEPKPPKMSEKSKSSNESGLTTLQGKMKAALDGARFRYVLSEA